RRAARQIGAQAGREQLFLGIAPRPARRHRRAGGLEGGGMTVAWPAPQATAVPSAWRRHLAALGLVWAGLLGLFHADAADMAAIWWNASTFNHCLLIGPIIVWLVRQRTPALRELAPSAWLPGLAWLGLGAFGWLLGEAGGVGLARHAGL